MNSKSAVIVCALLALLPSLAMAQSGSLDRFRRLVDGEAGWLAVLALRIATILHRPRGAHEVPAPALFHSRGSVRIETTHDWARRFPLSHQSLVAEAKEWSRSGIFEGFSYETIGMRAVGRR